MTTLLFQITFAPHGLEEKLGKYIVFNLKSRSHNEISGFLKISPYEMCAIGITYFRKLDNSEHQLFLISNLNFNTIKHLLNAVLFT